MKPMEVCYGVIAVMATELKRPLQFHDNLPRDVSLSQICFPLYDIADEPPFEALALDDIKRIGKALAHLIPRQAKKCFRLPLPRGVDAAYRAEEPASGLSLRMVRAYDVLEGKFVSRFDIAIA